MSILDHASLAATLPPSRSGGRHPHQPYPSQQQQQQSLGSSICGSSSMVLSTITPAVTLPLNVTASADVSGDAKQRSSSASGGGAYAGGGGGGGSATAVHHAQHSQQQQQLQMQQQQQQPPRVHHRRPRSIHITLRRTRSGSRPVTAQRNNANANVVSTSRELVGIGAAASKSISMLSSSGTVPTPPAATSPSSVSPPKAGTGTPLHQCHPQSTQYQRHGSLGSAYGTAGDVLSPMAVSPQLAPCFYDATAAAMTNNIINNGLPNPSGSPRSSNLPGYTPYALTPTRGQSGSGDATAAAAGWDNAGASGKLTAMASSSSSIVGGAGGSATSLGPSLVSGVPGPLPYGAGTFNAFVKPPYAHHPSMFKQAALLPPNMRERVLGPDAGVGSGEHGMGGGGGGVGRRRPLSSDPVARRASSSLSGSHSRVYAFQAPVITTATPSLAQQQQQQPYYVTGGNAGALRSNSMSGYHGVPGISSFVFPPRDVAPPAEAGVAATANNPGPQHLTHVMQHPPPPPQQQPQGPAWWGHLPSQPGVNLEPLSPQLSPLAEAREALGGSASTTMHAHPQLQLQQLQSQAPQRHYRARSYTAGRRQYVNCGADGQLSTPGAAAVAAPAALSPTQTRCHNPISASGGGDGDGDADGGAGTSDVGSAASRSLLRSLSGGSATPMAPSGGTAALTIGASSSTLVHPRSGSRRLSSSAVATSAPGVTITLPPAPSLTATCTDSATSTPQQPTVPTTPTARLVDHNNSPGVGGNNGNGSSTRHGTRVMTASWRAASAAAATVAVVSTVTQTQRPGSRPPVSVQSANFSSSAVRRSGSSDRVNGLDDSVDSVRCGSLPSTFNTLVSLGDAQGRLAAGASGSAERYGGGTAVFSPAHRYGRDHGDEAADKPTDDGSKAAAAGGGGAAHTGTSRRYGRHSNVTNTATEEESDAAAAAPPAAGQLSTLDILRGHQATAHTRKGSASGAAGGSRARAPRATTTTATSSNSNNNNPGAVAMPTTAIERWRAQDQQRRRDEAEALRRQAVAQQQRLTARQWREAFQRLQANRVRWHMRGYIGRGTSGVVYEGVLEDRQHTPVAVKVLEVGVPLPIDLDTGDGDGEEREAGVNARGESGGGGSNSNCGGGDAEAHNARRHSRPAAANRLAASAAAAAAASDRPCLSPSQQSALLVLLREVEMIEKLHHENIVTCLRCQVTPVQDRFLELHRRRNGSPSSPEKPAPQGRSDGTGGADGGGEKDNFRHSSASASRLSSGSHPSPYRAEAPLSGPARVPVQVEIVMELCKRGTLAGVVRRSPGGQLPVQTARRYLRDVLKGLAYLHRRNFIHRDVKGDNVLISGHDVAKLADFGCSRRIVMTNNVHGGMGGGGGGGGTGMGTGVEGSCRGASTGGIGGGGDGSSSRITTHTATMDSQLTTVADYQWFDTTGIAHTMVGTPMFMAPEIIEAAGAPPPLPETPSSDSPTSPTEHPGDDGAARGGNPDANGGGAAGAASASASAAAATGYTASADIWSFGCLVLEVFGRTPWPSAGHNAYHLMKQIEQSVADLPPGVPEDAPADLLHLLRCCFLRDPHRRSSARALLRLPWMTCKDAELEEVPPRRRR